MQPVVAGRARVAADQAGPAHRGPLTAALVACRPAEWAKNAFVLAPLVFSGRLEERSADLHAIAAFAAFCAASSAGYLVNDLRDASLDRQHPSKRHRPIARGELATAPAVVLATMLTVVAVVVGALAGASVAGLVAGYLALTFAYSAWLKSQVILDVLAIAGCFLIRVVAGSDAVGAVASQWLLVCTGMLALFLGFAKRRQEVASELHLGATSRPVLEHYSLPFLDQMVAMVTSGTVIAYVLYTVNSPVIGDRMLPTTVPVLYGVFRYLWLVYHRRDERDTATLVLHDPGMIGAGIAWVALAAALLYL